MLCLTRKSGETIVIGDDIIVKVISVRGDSVRLGIEAPLSVPVHREEIAEAFRRAEEGTDRV